MKIILKATAIMGGSSIVAILLAVIRNKILAILLGPAGIGLIGLLTNLQNTAGTLAGMGTGSSGIKEIAAANGRDDKNMIVSVYHSVFLCSIFFSTTVAILIYLFRSQVADFSLGNYLEEEKIVIIAIGAIILALASAQISLLNGLHRITDIARINICQAVFSLIISIILIWLFGQSAIIFIVLSIPCINLVMSSWFVQKIKLPSVRISLLSFFRISKSLLKLGIALMGASLMTTGTQMIVRIIITRKLGIESAGYFQAAWSISMMYLMFVLNSMAVEYFPRLSANIQNHEYSNSIINEQAKVVLLLASPVILLMIFCSPWVIRLLYTSDFGDTVSILRWQLLGDFFKVASWPLSFILPAKGKSSLFFFIECVWMITYLVIIWYGIPYWGIQSTGIAFFCAYVLYLFMNLFIANKINHFLWDKNVLCILLCMGTAVCSVMILEFIPGYFSSIVSFVIIVTIFSYSIITINREVGIMNYFQRKINGLKRKF